MILESKRLSANIELPAYCCVSGNPAEHPMVLLLPGYGQTPEPFLDKFGDCFNGYSLCVLQAPFPVPVKAKDKQGLQIGYSWYAYDATTGTYHIPMSTAVNFCLQIINKLGFKSQIKKLIGYSQGGYLAPFVAREIPSVTQVIGINCRFKNEDLDGHALPFRLDAINGASDRLVDPENAQRSHQKILEQGARGSFRSVPGEGHEITPAILQELKKMLAPAEKRD